MSILAAAEPQAIEIPVGEIAAHEAAVDHDACSPDVLGKVMTGRGPL